MQTIFILLAMLLSSFEENSQEVHKFESVILEEVNEPQDSLFVTREEPVLRE